MIGPMHRSRYSRVAIVLHWLMALLIIGNLAGGFLHDFVPREGGQRALVMGLHRSFGLMLLALVVVRTGWRLGHAPPALPHYFTVAERLLARATHGGFYVAMLVMPLLGWAMADGNDRPLHFLGLVDVPKMGVSKPLAGLAKEGHELLGWVILAMLTLHVAAIVKHAVLDRDNLLPRMGVGKPRGL
ncbi:cytochrome b [Sandarakinorhabdus sp.]|uniref:cytochrome b n=1 Tax=Sandarakinorhabdus sp. TaxID=1916663 RepID=UPI00286EB42C|nr:cytochrome b [Sandarakinorhabdus sp.]